MKKVLLTIDGLKPESSFFRYVLQFCQRMDLSLVILQILNPKRFKKAASRLQSKVQKTQDFLERSMTAAAFAEAGDQEMVQQLLEKGKKELDLLLPESYKSGVETAVKQKVGQPAEEFAGCLKECQDITVVFYSGPEKSEKKDEHDQDELAKLKKTAFKWGIPFVLRDSGYSRCLE